MPSDRGSAERDPRVLVDVMCGRLARYLRFAGYDAAYAGDRGLEADAALRNIAQSEDRQIITRDRELGARVDDALLLTETDLSAQLTALADAGFGSRSRRPRPAVASVMAGSPPFQRRLRPLMMSLIPPRSRYFDVKRTGSTSGEAVTGIGSARRSNRYRKPGIHSVFASHC